jgi:protein O-mannosyl-transferase
MAVLTAMAPVFPSAPSPASGFRRRLTSRWAVPLAGLAIVVTVLAAYRNSLSGPFVFDDLPAIRDNPTIRNWRAVGQVLSPPERLTVSGRPVLNATFALSHALSGGETWGYHAVNVAIHAAAALVLFGLVRRTLLRPGRCERFGVNALPLAFAVAVLWALHPLQTESVSYLVQRAESLMGLCYLLTLYCFVRGVDAARASGWFALAALVCALGMASKEVMVSAPLLVLLYDRCFVAGSFAEAWRQRARCHASLAATLLVLGLLVAHAGGNRGGSIGFGIGIGWWAHALTQFHAITHYLWLSLWPHPLVFEYEPEWVTRMVDVVLPGLLVIALLVVTTVGLGRNRSIGFVGMACFAVIAPTSLLPAPTQLIVEHRMYLPLAALIAWLVPVASAWLGRRELAALLAVGLGFGLLTARRNEDYRSEISLWADTVAKRPRNAFAHGSLGAALSRAGRLDDALVQCTEAVRLDPEKALLRYNLGLVFAKLGRQAEAIEAYAQAVSLQPDYADAHNNYAVTLARVHRTEEARREFEATLRLRPDDAEAHYNLGALLLELRRAPDAVEQFAAALRLKPDYPAAGIAAGTTLALLGRFDEAMRRFEQVLVLNPRDTVARNKVGLMLLAIGRVPEAIAHFEEALRIKPDDPDTRANLAMARTRLVNSAPHD